MLFILLLYFPLVKGCKINGFEMGSCVSLEEVKSKIDFCADALSGNICVPETHLLWPDYGIKERDANVHDIFIKQIESTLVTELTTAEPKDMYLTTKKNCYTTFKNFICRWNFPRCIKSNKKSNKNKSIETDTTPEATLPVCMQDCVDFHKNCGLSTNLCNVNYPQDPGLDTDSKCHG